MPEYRRMAGILTDRNTKRFGNLLACFPVTQKFDVFRPWQRNKHAYPHTRAAIEKPARWSVINPHQVQATLAHQSKIDIDLLRSSQIISVRVRLKGSVSDAFDKKLLVPFENKFRY